MSHSQPPPTGHIALNCRHAKLMFTDAMFSPKILLDGYQVAGGWGRQVFPSWPGRHLVNVHARYMGTNMWNTDLWVDVYPGHMVELEFMAPNTSWNWNAKAALYHVPRR